nr:protein BREAKING OF ASYMMETRY IN THE STOMATAL LINEAGE [Quercus suber]
MCTPWTIPRFVRWRVRDWASCFLACRFPIDDEPNTYRSSSPQPVKNMSFDKKGDSKANQNNKKMSWHKKRSKEKRPKLSSTQQPKDSNNNIPVENGADEARWPHFSDEEYIVFCFREDGAFDVVKDGKPETSKPFDCTSRNSRPVNRKDEEEDCIYFDTESPTHGFRRRYQSEEVEDRGLVSVESSESNLSDGSSRSFAFPVLGWEWMGSPVQMPKSEGLQLRKHKARFVGFQCCKF